MEDNDLADKQDYTKYSLWDLYDTLNNINAGKYPENFAALEAEIGTRQSASYAELRKCWSLLERKY